MPRYNRLTNINYPNNQNHNVTYTYGNNAGQNNAGRITKITDRSFINNHYNYDSMQNIIGVSNKANVAIGSSTFGGATAQNFTYDNLYQTKVTNG